MEETRKIAVIIPCFNEEKTIGKVVNDFKRELPDADIYVYDNNSTDATAKLAKQNGAIVRLEKRQGKGNVIRTAFREIDADCYILVDGDDTYPAETVKEMADEVLYCGKDMVIGDRLSGTYFTENKRPFHNTGNRLVRFLINRIFESNLKDMMTGYRAFSKRFVKTYPALSKGFETETEMTIHALDKNMNIKEIPVVYRDRPDGSESKLNTYTDGFKVLKTIFSLFRLYKPFQFFGILAIIMAAMAAGLFIPVFIEYVNTGLVERFPTLIVSGFLFLASMLSFFSGLILDTIARKHRELFEIALHRAV